MGGKVEMGLRCPGVGVRMAGRSLSDGDDVGPCHWIPEHNHV